MSHTPAERKTKLWDTWIVIVGGLLIGFGVLLAFANQTELLNLVFNRSVNAVFWPHGNLGLAVQRFQQFVYGMLGMTVAGWGVCIVHIARHAFAWRERWAWTSLAGSVALWFVPDTWISLSFGV